MTSPSDIKALYSHDLNFLSFFQKKFEFFSFYPLKFPIIVIQYRLEYGDVLLLQLSIPTQTIIRRYILWHTRFLMSASLAELALRLALLTLSKRAIQSTKLIPMSASSAELALRLALLMLPKLNNFAYVKSGADLKAKTV